jgi:hypothetical protein
MPLGRRELVHVDLQLRAVKDALVSVRGKHGVRGDVTFRLVYAPAGQVTSAVVVQVPPGTQPDFSVAAAATVAAVMKFPRTQTGGVMDFTDLGPESSVDARAVNRESDQLQARDNRTQAAKETRTLMILIAVLAPIGIVIGVVQFMSERKQRTSAPAPSGDPRPIEIAADALRADYASGRDLAERSYRGKTLCVTGEIAAIAWDTYDRPIVSFRTRDPIAKVLCLFDAPNGGAAALAHGTTARLCGTGAGLNGDSPELRGCAFPDAWGPAP